VGETLCYVSSAPSVPPGSAAARVVILVLRRPGMGAVILVLESLATALHQGYEVPTDTRKKKDQQEQCRGSHVNRKKALRD
jgi:hypothetical protein